MITKVYKDHTIEIDETSSGCKYVIKKDRKKIFESSQTFSFPPEAEVEAKIYINKITASNNGWMIS
jgi:hypothetical protein